LVASRRDAQTIYYLGGHDFFDRLRDVFFGAWAL
jgi:hypothetical protein